MYSRFRNVVRENFCLIKLCLISIDISCDNLIYRNSTVTGCPSKAHMTHDDCNERLQISIINASMLLFSIFIRDNYSIDSPILTVLILHLSNWPFTQHEPFEPSTQHGDIAQWQRRWKHDGGADSQQVLPHDGNATSFQIQLVKLCYEYQQQQP